MSSFGIIRNYILNCSTLNNLQNLTKKYVMYHNYFKIILYILIILKKRMQIKRGQFVASNYGGVCGQVSLGLFYHFLSLCALT